MAIFPNSFNDIVPPKLIAGNWVQVTTIKRGERVRRDRAIVHLFTTYLFSFLILFKCLGEKIGIKWVNGQKLWTMRKDHIWGSVYANL